MTTDTITIPADKAKRLKLCVDTIAGYHRFGPGQDGYQAVKELKEFVESIQEKTRYIYPTPAEACRMIADAGGPVECEFSDRGERWGKGNLHAIDMGGVNEFPFYVYSNGWYSKIRVLKPE